ncbi:hypothetical protein DZF79_14380 [Vibrio parahaemolyticus]|nr:hypothetical protein [Vibrio parahaemolyticus]
MKRLTKLFKTMQGESQFTRDQYNKIIWPTPKEALNIFGWTSAMLVTFAILITFVFDPLSIEIVRFLSGFK